MAHLNNVGFRAAGTGTGSFVVADGLPGFATPAQAGATNATTYAYKAQYVVTGTEQWEVGTGTYTAAGTSLSRTVLMNSNGDTSPISFLSAPEVYIVPLAADMIDPANVAITGGSISGTTFSDIVSLEFAGTSESPFLVDLANGDSGHEYGIGRADSDKTWSGRGALSYHVNSGKSHAWFSSSWEKLMELTGAGGDLRVKGSITADGGFVGVTASLTDLAQDVGGTTGLDYAYMAGRVNFGPNYPSVSFSASTITLDDESTLYVSAKFDGTVEFNATGFADSPGNAPMAIVTTIGGNVDTVTDARAFLAGIPAGGGGGVETIVAGDGISVDATDPANPIVSATGGGLAEIDVTAGTVTPGVFTIASLRNVARVNLTTDGTGECTLDIAEYPFSGQAVNFVIEATGDPGDTVVIPNILQLFFKFTATLSGVDARAALLYTLDQNDDNCWQIDGASLTKQTAFVSDDEPNTRTNGYFGSGQNTTTITDLEFGPFDGSINVQAPNGGGAVTGVKLLGVNQWSGVPFPIILTMNGDSPDTISFNTETFVDLTGAEPTSIVFTTNGEAISLVPYDGSRYMILGASAGVVTM